MNHDYYDLNDWHDYEKDIVIIQYIRRAFCYEGLPAPHAFIMLPLAIYKSAKPIE